MNRDEVINFLSSHRQELEERFRVFSLALFGSTARNACRFAGGLRPKGPPFFSPGHRPGFRGTEKYHAA